MTWPVWGLAAATFLVQLLLLRRYDFCGAQHPCPGRWVPRPAEGPPPLLAEVRRARAELRTVAAAHHAPSATPTAPGTARGGPGATTALFTQSPGADRGPELPDTSPTEDTHLHRLAVPNTPHRPSPAPPRAPAVPAPSDPLAGAALFVPPTAAADGALCLDGTPAGYYLRPGAGPNATRWVLFLEGGGWCYSNHTCLERRTRWYSMGSMKSRPKRFVLKHGFGSPDPATNPDFHDWTHVFFIYCDGSSFTSNQAEPLFLPAPLFNNSLVALYFRGYRVLQTTLTSLLAVHGLGGATEVMLAGHSAGAMAVVLHANAIRRRLPASARVFAVVDAGLFIDYCNATMYARSHCNFMKAAPRLWNATGLDPRCLSEEPELWRCLFPGYSLRYVQIPTFVVQHIYDNWAVKNLLGFKWVSYNNRLERAQLDRITEYGRQVEAAIGAHRRRAEGGLFLSKCELGVHGELLMHHWGQHTIQGATPQAALHQWYRGACRRTNRCQWVEACDWPREYGANMTRVEEGVLDACLLPAGRREVGLVQQFRPAGECPAGSKFVLQRQNGSFVWAPMDIAKK